MNYGSKLSKFFPIKNALIKPQIREYAFKSDLKIKWVRPEKIPCYKPEKSGDLETYPKIDLTQIRDEFKNCKELENANELVRKLFSLEFSNRKYTHIHYTNKSVEKVQRHNHDTGSHEVRIAKLTGCIRAMQETMERNPRKVKVKVQLKELIDSRKKQLKHLRRWDYKRFEWILETLNLSYKPMPLDVHWITRKDSLRKLTDKYCEGVRNDKLEKYKLQLQAEQPAFLEEKIRTLEFIRAEQEACGVEVTVSQEEIDGVKKQLEQLQEENKKRQEEES